MERNELMRIFAEKAIPTMKNEFMQIGKRAIEEAGLSDNDMLNAGFGSIESFLFYRLEHLRREQEIADDLKYYKEQCERYDYEGQVKSDVLDYIKENYSVDEIVERLADDKDGWIEELNDDLFVSDSVTGNASGSYYCNSWRAENAICHNLELLGDAIREFGDSADILEKGAEGCDVTIRCYLLGGAIQDVVNELEEEYEDAIEKYLYGEDDEEEENDENEKEEDVE